MRVAALRQHARADTSALGEKARELVHLILASADDPLAMVVADRFEGMGETVIVLDHPFAVPFRCTWFLDDDNTVLTHTANGGGRIDNAHVGSVLVCGQPRVDPTSWVARDLAYAHAELHAAVLGWLHGLDCPVINRHPSWTWFRRGPRLSDWYPALRAAGLPFQDALLTNDSSGARAFCENVVVNPMTSEAAWLIDGDRDWDALSKFMSRTPAHITRPHGEPRFACVAGQDIVWSHAPGAENGFEHLLQRFSAYTGLSFFEVAIAPVDGDERVIAVDAFPTLLHQPASNHSRIIDALVSMMTGAIPIAPAGRLP